MADWLGQAALVLIGALMATTGFVARRYITKAGSHEEVTLYTLLADLKAKMAEQGVSAADLDQFAAQLSPKVREANAKAIRSEDEEPQHYWTQGAMNERGWAEYELERARLGQALAEFGTLLGNTDQLQRVQEAWESYRDEAAEMAAAEVRGGSIQPLIRSGELTSLTRERLARVLADIEDRRSRYG